MGVKKMNSEDQDHSEEVRELMEREASVRERVDEQGNRWSKAYFGGGEHFKNWLDQCKEMGEVMVEEVSPKGYKCFEMAGEKLYRIWVKMDPHENDDLF
jgi:hypothetical protein